MITTDFKVMVRKAGDQVWGYEVASNLHIRTNAFKQMVISYEVEGKWVRIIIPADPTRGILQYLADKNKPVKTDKWAGFTKKGTKKVGRIATAAAGSRQA